MEILSHLHIWKNEGEQPNLGSAVVFSGAVIHRFVWNGESKYFSLFFCFLFFDFFFPLSGILMAADGMGCLTVIMPFKHFVWLPCLNLPSSLVEVIFLCLSSPKLFLIRVPAVSQDQTCSLTYFSNIHLVKYYLYILCTQLDSGLFNISVAEVSLFSLNSKRF